MSNGRVNHSDPSCIFKMIVQVIDMNKNYKSGIQNNTEINVTYLH